MEARNSLQRAIGCVPEASAASVKAAGEEGSLQVLPLSRAFRWERRPKPAMPAVLSSAWSCFDCLSSGVTMPCSVGEREGEGGRGVLTSR